MLIKWDPARGSASQCASLDLKLSGDYEGDKPMVTKIGFELYTEWAGILAKLINKWNMLSGAFSNQIYNILKGFLVPSFSYFCLNSCKTDSRVSDCQSRMAGMDQIAVTFTLSYKFLRWILGAHASQQQECRGKAVKHKLHVVGPWQALGGAMGGGSRVVCLKTWSSRGFQWGNIPNSLLFPWLGQINEAREGSCLLRGRQQAGGKFFGWFPVQSTVLTNLAVKERWREHDWAEVCLSALLDLPTVSCRSGREVYPGWKSEAFLTLDLALSHWKTCMALSDATLHRLTEKPASRGSDRVSN